jgi:hypothetical protein
LIKTDDAPRKQRPTCGRAGTRTTLHLSRPVTRASSALAASKGAKQPRLFGFQTRLAPGLDDYELIAERLSDVSSQVKDLESRVSGLLTRMTDVEKVNARMEEAALTTARALAEISGHWDAVYEAIRRKDRSEEAPDR